MSDSSPQSITHFFYLSSSSVVLPLLIGSPIDSEELSSAIARTSSSSDFSNDFGTVFESDLKSSMGVPISPPLTILLSVDSVWCLSRNTTSSEPMVQQALCDQNPCLEAYLGAWGDQLWYRMSNYRWRGSIIWQLGLWRSWGPWLAIWNRKGFQHFENFPFRRIVRRSVETSRQINGHDVSYCSGV